MNIIKKLLPIGLATFIVLVSAAVFFSSADELDEGRKGHKFNPEHRAAIQEAVENNDYDAWVAAISQDGREPKMLEFITEENFSKLAELHALKQEGKFDEAKALAEELGLPQHKMGKRGFKGHGNRPELTDEQKAIMEQVRELKQAGDIEGAKALFEESGIQFPKMGKKKSFMKKGNHPELTDEQKAIMEQVHELKQAGDIEGAKALLEEAGIDFKHKFKKFRQGRGHWSKQNWNK